MMALLDDGPSSLQARLSLIDAAQSEILLAYWGIDSSEAPRQIISQLCQRARSGVTVRILADGFGTRLAEDMAAQMAAAGVQVRIYHPLLSGRPEWLNCRLHSKLMVVDRKAMVIGSRNLGDDYLRQTDPSFVDCDALVLGPICDQAAEYIERLWISSDVVALDQCHPIVMNGPNSYSRWTMALLSTPVEAVKWLTGTTETDSTSVHPNAPIIEQPAYRTVSFQTAIGLSDELEWQQRLTPLNVTWHVAASNQITLLYDQPPVKTSTAMAQRLIQLIDSATQSVVIESPYPAFSDAFSAALQRAAARGVAVHLVTNSLASTNHLVVYAAYQNQKNALLNSGVKIYEFIGTQHLHAKNLVIDQRIAMLGSYNFNQRSEISDLEFCIVTEDPGAAAALLQSIAKRGASTQPVTATFIAAPLNSGTPLRRVTTRAAQIVAPLIRPLL
ncbi:MAG TPA: hypothetical protein DCF63_16435 [Planctomycetaceae bacterium]|nr:hypothetical protein [Planctomycetaceae bacterium]